VLYVLTNAVALIYQNSYTITFVPLIIFTFICYIYKDEIKEYDYNSFINGKDSMKQVFWTFVSVLIGQGVANIVLHSLIHFKHADIDYLLNIAIIPIATVIFIPIIEEVVFRKIIFGWIDKRYNFWTGSVISSTLFMVGHLNYAGWLGYFAIGMIWCYTYKRTGNLAVNIITHMLLNLSFFVVITFQN
jgi:membrane protease YdiL (CAAX protease family)